MNVKVGSTSLICTWEVQLYFVFINLKISIFVEVAKLPFSWNKVVHVGTSLRTIFVNTSVFLRFVFSS